MANLTLNNKALDKYFGLLNSLDNHSKKKLIIKLTESLDIKPEKVNLKSLYGAWEDSKDSDEIIKEIRESRVERRQLLEKKLKRESDLVKNESMIVLKEFEGIDYAD